MTALSVQPVGPGVEPVEVAAGVLAGLGAVSAVGADVEECFTALLAGQDGRAELQVFDRSRFGAQFAYELQDRPDGLDRPWRASDLLTDAVGQAVRAAGLSDLSGVPVLVGTGLREMRSAELAWLSGAALDPDRLHFGPALRDAFGADDVHTFSNACSASLYAAGLGLDLLALGHEAVVIGGVDVLTASMYGLLDRVHLQPPDRIRPFDAARRGVLIGEGAAAVVLTRGPGGPDSVLLRAVALGCDAYHLTAPDPAGIEETIREAHRAAGLGPDQIDLVYTHGTGTHLNDEAEATALSRVFPAAGASPALAAVKSMTGHTSGGSGLFSLVMAVRSLQSGQLPGVLHLSELTAAAQGLSLTAASRTIPDPTVAQVDAFGFGGLNAVAILQRSAATTVATGPATGSSTEEDR